MRMNKMNKEIFEKELKMCRDLSKRNDGGCNWGRCTDCGVIPLLYKLGKGELYEEEGKVKELKKFALEGD